MPYKDREKHREKIANRMRIYREKYKKTCYEKIREYQRRYAMDNKEKKAAYRKENIEKIKARERDYREKNKEKLKEIRISNKEKARKYYMEHKAKLKKQQSLWRQLNRDKCRLNYRKRKALECGVLHEPYSDYYIYNRDGWICGICGKKINKKLKYPNPLSASLDHIVPISKKGADSAVNVQASHLRCNLKKHSTIIGQLRLFG